MKIKFSKTIVFFVLTISTFSCSWVKLTQVTTAKKIKNTHFLALPELSMEIEVPIKEITFKKGKEFHSTITQNDLNRLSEVFGVDKTVYSTLKSKAQVKKYKIDDSNIKYSSRADESKFYSIEHKSFLTKQDITLKYSSNGSVSTFEATTESLLDDYLVKGITSIGSIIAGIRGSESATTTAFSDSKLKALDILLSKYQKLIYNESTNVIMDSEVYKDQKGQLQKQIKAIIEKHVYSAKTKAEIAKVSYTPSKTTSRDGSQILLFKVENDGSIVPNTNLNGQISIYYLRDIGAPKGLSNLEKNTYYVTFNKVDDPFTDLISDNEPVNLGYPYNVPEVVLFEYGKIVDTSGNKSKIILEKLKIPQFGFVAFLSRKISKATIEYDSLTGEIRSVTSTSSENFAENISNLGTSTESLLKAIKPDDEVSKLEREATILELRKKIEDLKEGGDGGDEN